MNRQTRIGLKDTIQDAVLKLSEGNPGAVTVCMEILDKARAGMLALLHLDSLGIYGPRIWMLYKDVCGHDLTKVLGLLRACQLGFLPEPHLHFAIDNRGQGLDIDSLLSQVREELPDFGREYEHLRVSANRGGEPTPPVSPSQ